MRKMGGRVYRLSHHYMVLRSRTMHRGVQVGGGLGQHAHAAQQVAMLVSSLSRMRELAHGPRVRLHASSCTFTRCLRRSYSSRWKLGLARPPYQCMFCKPGRCILARIDLSASGSVGNRPVHERPRDPARLLHPSRRITTDGSGPSSAMRATVIRLMPRSPAVSSRSSRGLSPTGALGCAG
jgi:hypothetical protein